MHKHSSAKIEERGFTGPVSRDQNRAAHGGVCLVETCECGAVRCTNVNGNHSELGPWEAPAAYTVLGAYGLESSWHGSLEAAGAAYTGLSAYEQDAKVHSARVVDAKGRDVTEEAIGEWDAARAMRLEDEIELDLTGIAQRLGVHIVDPPLIWRGDKWTAEVRGRRLYADDRAGASAFRRLGAAKSVFGERDGLVSAWKREEGLW